MLAPVRLENTVGSFPERVALCHRQIFFLIFGENGDKKNLLYSIGHHPSSRIDALGGRRCQGPFLFPPGFRCCYWGGGSTRPRASWVASSSSAVSSAVKFRIFFWRAKSRRPQTRRSALRAGEMHVTYQRTSASRFAAQPSRPCSAHQI